MLSSITAKTSIGLDCRFEQHDGCLIRSRNCLPSASTRVHPWCFGGVRVAFHVVLLCVFTFLVSCCDVRYDFHIRTVRLFVELVSFLWCLTPLSIIFQLHRGGAKCWTSLYAKIHKKKTHNKP
jgi:hypothetical protein